MINYINQNRGRLVGRNNNVCPPLVFAFDTIAELSFQFIDDRQQIQHLDPSELSGLYFAGSLKLGEQSYNLLFLSKDYTVENDTVTFSTETYTIPYLEKIRKPNTEIWIEMGQISLDKKRVLMRSNALAFPRCYSSGNDPLPIDTSNFFTKEETQELLAQNLSSAQAYADGQDAATLASATAYTDEQISALDLSQFATDADLQAAKTELDGKIASKQDKITSENKLPYSLISDTPTIPTKTSELTNDSTFQTAQDVQNAISGKADQSALTAHTSDATIHVTTADKTAWNGKLDPSALNGYATEQYVDGQVSGKADQSALTAHTSDTEIHTTALEKAAWNAKQNAITADNKLDYALLSGEPDLSVYAKPNCLRLTAKAANSTVGLKLAGNATAKNVEWSSDEGATWTAFTWTNGYTNVVTLANAGDSIILRCNDWQFSTGDNDWVQFVLTGSIAASGNVMSLLSNDALLDEVPAYAFLNLFRDQTALVEAPELPAMKLNYRSYFCMFYGCSLAHAPKLPAEQYAEQCYGSMFGGGHQTFTSIEIAGQWNAIGSDISAMEKMFKGCSALNSVTIHWTNWPFNGGTTNWLQNVSASGTFYCPYGLDTSIRDESHIPAGWNVVYTSVPESVLSGAAAATEALTMING